MISVQIGPSKMKPVALIQGTMGNDNICPEKIKEIEEVLGVKVVVIPWNLNLTIQIPENHES